MRNACGNPHRARFQSSGQVLSLAAALLYWGIVAAWLTVAATLSLAFVHNPRTFGTTRLLLIVLVIDACRNVFENCYFGLYFGAQYGLFRASIVPVLGNSSILIVPKLLNAAAACLVLAILLWQWLPMASKERASIDNELRQKSEALAREIEERRRLFETSLDLILVTDSRGNFTQVSPSALTTIGYRPDEMVGHSGSEFIYPLDLEPTRDEMRLARRGRDTRNFETRYVNRNGGIVELAWSGVWSEPEKRHFFFGRDMTEANAAKRKLRHLALFDQLTGLPNRVSLENDLGELLVNRPDSECGAGPSIALLDFDGFKEINNTFGNSIGDKLQQEVAERLKAVGGGHSRLYRWSDDEFALLLPNSGDPQIAPDVVSSVLKCLDENFQVDGHQIYVGASAGVAVAPRDGVSAKDLLWNADLSLRDAKAAGNHIMRLYSPSLRAQAEERRQLGNELRRAWANQEFVLHFQPQLRLRDEIIVGAEALLRWRHPQRGLLAPSAFIDALADSPIALDVGRWILVNSCQHAAEWRTEKASSIRIGVNLFPAHFRDKTLLGDVRAALAESGLPPEALELEITENIALAYDDELLDLLKQLRSDGVGLAFDDFGTGFASLSYLARFPLTRIKIDRSFVRSVSNESNSVDTAIVRSIVVMAHNLGLEVIAEGVETPAQAAFLRTNGCDEVQGFLYARPLPAEQFEEFMESRREYSHARQEIAG